MGYESGSSYIFGIYVLMIYVLFALNIFLEPWRTAPHSEFGYLTKIVEFFVRFSTTRPEVPAECGPKKSWLLTRSPVRSQDGLYRLCRRSVESKTASTQRQWNHIQSLVVRPTNRAWDHVWSTVSPPSLSQLDYPYPSTQPADQTEQLGLLILTTRSTPTSRL